MAIKQVSGLGVILFAVLLLSWSHTAFGIRGLPMGVNITATANTTFNATTGAPMELRMAGAAMGTSLHEKLKAAVERVLESDASLVEETQLQASPVTFSGLGCHGIFVSQEHAWMCAGR